jgi:hypothetical protein
VLSLHFWYLRYCNHRILKTLDDQKILQKMDQSNLHQINHKLNCNSKAHLYESFKLLKKKQHGAVWLHSTVPIYLQKIPLTSQ